MNQFSDELDEALRAEREKDREYIQKLLKQGDELQRERDSLRAENEEWQTVDQPMLQRAALDALGERDRAVSQLAELTAERDKLKAELAELQECLAWEINSHADHVNRLSAELEESRAECERLRRTIERNPL